jgi:hypothetical protein
MRKAVRKEMGGLAISEEYLKFFSKAAESPANYYGADSVENFKRRRALPPFSTLDAGARLFFERILAVKKDRELVFFTKASAKSR